MPLSTPTSGCPSTTSSSTSRAGGTGELKQYDVSDPFHPREVGSVQVGGIGRETPHPAKPAAPLRGGPQMVEVSRDGRRVYFTNSLYGAWDDQFYPAGVGHGWPSST